MSNSAISIKSLNKHYGSFHALKGIDLEVREGETLVICGPSGSGKSTLVRCMNGLESYTDGNLEVLGITIGDDTQQLDRVRKRVGMVFQGFNLFPHLTILENCVLPQLRALGRDRATSTIEAVDQLKRMQVYVHSEKFPDQLSGGQQQRVPFAYSRRLCCLTSLPPHWTRK